MAADHKHHQVIIVGAGPGGLQLGYFLGRASVDYLILERSSNAGSFFEHLPVHRTLLSINKINTGYSDSEKNFRWDWNSLISDDCQFTLSSYDQDFFPHADSLVRYLRDYCARAHINAQFQCEVTAIAKQNGKFLLETAQHGQLTCDLLVIATGTSTPYTPDIQGVELVERYGAHDRSADRFRNKDILIIGKGNSAFETAQELLPHAARIHLISPRYLKWAWQTHFPGDLRQINSPFFETFLLKQQNAVLNGTINSIQQIGEKYSVSINWSENGYPDTFIYDRVILCTGYKFDTSPFAGNLKPDLIHRDRLPALTYQWESQNIPGLYFCGALMQANDYKKSASAFIHGMRYNIRTLGRFIEARLNVHDLPTVPISSDAGVLFEQIHERIQRSSSLWHMHGSLCDAYVFDEKARYFKLMEDMPVKAMTEDPSFRSTSRIEFRFTFDNPKDPVERANFTPIGLLHPALYFFRNGDFVRECHMYEDIYTDWHKRDDWWGPLFKDALSKFIVELGATYESTAA